MTNHASKLLFQIAAFGFAAAVGYQWVIGDRAGSLLFLGVGVVAVLAGLSVQGAVGRDWAPRVEPDATPDARPVDALDVARPSPWPLVAAIGVADAAIGAAYGAEWLLLGLGVAAIPAVGWLVQTWREHPAWTPRMGDRLSQRLIAPVATPVGTLIIALFVAVSLSRVLLAVSATASWVFTLVVAAGVLAALSVIAARPRLSQGAVVGIGALGVAATVGVGVVGAAAGEREFHGHEDPQPSVHVEAVNIEFDTNTIELPAEAESRIEFRNLDTGVYHNVAFYTAKENGRPLFNGKPIPSGEIDYSFKTPKQPGTYYFVCDFHPNMEGDFVVTPADERSDGHGPASDEEHDA